MRAERRALDSEMQSARPQHLGVFGQQTCQQAVEATGWSVKLSSLTASSMRCDASRATFFEPMANAPQTAASTVYKCLAMSQSLGNSNGITAFLIFCFTRIRRCAPAAANMKTARAIALAPKRRPFATSTARAWRSRSRGGLKQTAASCGRRVWRRDRWGFRSGT